MSLSRRRLLAAVPAAAALAACGPAVDLTGPLRLGFFPNITHAAALVGVERGMLRDALQADGIGLEVFPFNAGPAAIEALLSGALHASYVGPNPAINAFVKSRGEGVRVIAGAAIGGASLVVRPEIAAASDLRGKRVASPQLGGTQDVALRTWLIGQGLTADEFGGGDVSVSPRDNAQTLEGFRAGELAGAWVPEPWATRLVVEGGGKVLVDERALWPGGRFTTTVLLVRSDYLAGRPEAVRALLRGHVAAIRWIGAEPAAARETVNAAIRRISGKALPPAVIERAWQGLEFVSDPVPTALAKDAEDAAALGFVRLRGVDVAGLCALDLLREVEAAAPR